MEHKKNQNPKNDSCVKKELGASSLSLLLPFSLEEDDDDIAPKRLGAVAC